MTNRFINELLLTYKNYYTMIQELNKKPSLAKKLTTTTKVLKEGIRTLKTLKEMTPDQLERFKVEAEHLDSLYDSIECYPDEFGIPSNYKPIAMPYVQYIIHSKGINELELEDLRVKSSMRGYRSFNWSL